jgi:hypothetical protein
MNFEKPPQSEQPEEKIEEVLPAKAEKTKTENPAEKSYQEMEGLVGELAARSRFERMSEGDKEFIVSSEGEKFGIRRIEDPKDPAVDKIYELLKKRFDEDELDTKETMIGAIENDYASYHVVEDKDGNILCHACTELLEVESAQPRKRGQPKESVLFVGYIVTNNELRYQDPKTLKSSFMSQEIFQNVFREAVDDAREKKLAIKGLVGESVDELEPLVNRFGAKRIYFEDENGNVQEVEFTCPPLDWDSQTGEPRKEPTAEHLITRFMDGRQSFKKEELLAMVRSIYEENYVFPPEMLPSRKARKRNQEIVEGYYKKLEESLAQVKDGELFLMDYRERRRRRAELEAQGKQIIEGEDESK